MIRQSADHDSGWGAAVYERPDGAEPDCARFPNAAYADGEFEDAADRPGRIFNVHVRRATMGGLTAENTHPFCLGNYSFSHNGTVLESPALREPGVRPPTGDTDSEQVFNFIMRDFDPADPPGSLRHALSAIMARSSFSGLNLLFSDGERLYAYKLGIFDLHWLSRPGQLLVASEQITDEPWHAVSQDVLLTLDPADPEEPHAERLLGDELVSRADIQPEVRQELRGAERGTFAAERAARLAASAGA